MDDEVDRQAAEQIAQLFQVSERTVWEIVGSPRHTHQGDVPIHRADGRVLGVARPADDLEPFALARLLLPVPVQAPGRPTATLASTGVLLVVLTLIVVALSQA